MKIKLKFLGLINELIGRETVTFGFEKDASFGDVLAEIHRRYNDILPEGIWDRKKQEFRPGIICVGAGGDLKSKDIMLKNGEEVSIVIHMAGG